MKKLLLSTFITLMLWGSSQAGELLEPSLNALLEKGYKIEKIELLKQNKKIFTLRKGKEYVLCKVFLVGDIDTTCWRP